MRSRSLAQQGFTLIELLVVIAIIGILTSLIMAVLASVNPGPKLARKELAQLESAIREYKEKTGSYPPDNPNNPVINPLYFELLGTTNNGDVYRTLDGSGQISNSTGDINTFFGQQGFANTTPRAHSTDDSAAAMSFLDHLRKNQIGQPDAGKPLIKILVCSVEWPEGASPAPIPNTRLNPWRYVSSHPANNPGSYDLWVDLIIRGKTYRISNWSQQPQIVP